MNLNRAVTDFYITFHEKFADHATESNHFPAANPKGWARITANSLEEAKAYADDHFGDTWDTIKRPAGFSWVKHYYPLGELTHHTVNADITHEPTC